MSVSAFESQFHVSLQRCFGRLNGDGADHLVFACDHYYYVCRVVFVVVCYYVHGQSYSKGVCVLPGFSVEIWESQSLGVVVVQNGD